MRRYDLEKNRPGGLPHQPRCSVDDCERPATKGGLCVKHRYRLMANGDPADSALRRRPGRVCSVPGCTKKHHSRGLCSTHLWRLRTYGATGGAVGRRGVSLDLSNDQEVLN